MVYFKVNQLKLTIALFSIIGDHINVDNVHEQATKKVFTIKYIQYISDDYYAMYFAGRNTEFYYYLHKIQHATVPCIQNNIIIRFNMAVIKLHL